MYGMYNQILIKHLAKLAQDINYNETLDFFIVSLN